MNEQRHGRPGTARSSCGPAFTSVSNRAFGIGSNLAWASYQRELYDQLNASLQKQANVMRINQAFLGWLRRREPRPAVTVVGDAIVVGEQRLALADVAGVVA